MPVGYLLTVTLVSWGVTCALTRWRRPGPVCAIPALLVNELPFIVGYVLVASTVLALIEGDLDSVAGAVGAGVALLALAGLGVIADRATRAHAALHLDGRPHRPWARILAAPFVQGSWNLVRVPDHSYGDGSSPTAQAARSRRTLDVYHRRDRPSGVPVLLHLHGGGFHSGDKRREARPLIRHLTATCGIVCVSANYRLQPQATLAEQMADAHSAIAWVREHAAEYGGNPEALFITGSSAGAYLAIRAVGESTDAIAGLIGRYGYYGDLTLRDGPPLLVIHGQNDLVVPASHARAFAERSRAASRAPVRYAELPGAHHDFDLFESIRSAAVNQAIAAFIADSTRTSPSPPG